MVQISTDFPAMCDICGELFGTDKWDNVTTAIGVIEDGKVTKLYCAECFLEEIAKQLPDKMKEVAKELINSE